MRGLHGPHTFFQPVDQGKIVSGPTKECLAKMNVRLNKTGYYNAATRVDNNIRTLIRGSQLSDSAMDDQEISPDDPVRGVDRNQHTVFYENRRHKPQRGTKSTGANKHKNARRA
jgi:hypothetical protein